MFSIALVKLIGCRVLRKSNVAINVYEYTTETVLRSKTNKRTIWYDKEGEVLFKEWFYKGVYHRIGGPSSIHYNDCVVESEAWYIRGLFHRTGGPSNKSYWRDGSYRVLEWHEDGLLHRFDGPAYIEFRDDGSTWSVFA